MTNTNSIIDALHAINESTKTNSKQWEDTLKKATFYCLNHINAVKRDNVYERPCPELKELITDFYDDVYRGTNYTFTTDSRGHYSIIVAKPLDMKRPTIEDVVEPSYVGDYKDLGAVARDGGRFTFEKMPTMLDPESTFYTDDKVKEIEALVKNAEKDLKTFKSKLGCSNGTIGRNMENQVCSIVWATNEKELMSIYNYLHKTDKGFADEMKYREDMAERERN